MTMREVIDRVRGELNQQYLPLIAKYKEELQAKDQFFLRELEKQRNQFTSEQFAAEEQLRRLDMALKDYQAKYSDKCMECESYISISEHRLELYNELMARKKETEDTRAQLVSGLEAALEVKEREAQEAREELRRQVQEL